MKLQAIRGMNDILPEQAPIWQGFETCVRDVLAAYGYHEIRLPIVEQTQLFSRSIGDITDIVEKEMYSFEDRNGESLTLRPEGTAGCVRACIQNGLLHNQVQRLWYGGPMFRYERPQKGRYRQFHQFGAEAYGLDGPDIDAELILLSARIWQRLGIEGLSLQLNSLGSPESRQRYRDRLVNYFDARKALLDDDSRRRLASNPLRILDSKNPALSEVIAEAPSLLDSLDDASQRHFDELRELLESVGQHYVVNPRLVRGLDYYTRTVFEWVTDQLGAQGTVCAGGRYDGLVELLGGRATPGVGFAMGIERLIAMLQAQGFRGIDVRPHAYLVLSGEGTLSVGLSLAEHLRTQVPGLRVQAHCGGGGFKSQLKRADKSGADYALILGADELAQGRVGVKHLRGGGEQSSMSRDEVPAFLELHCLG